MAIKGVTWIEQHFEKIVLAAVGATALGILGWQFVGRQSTITLNNKQVALDQANAELKAKALEIQSKIRATDPKMPEKFPVTAIATDFQKRHNSPVTRAPLLDWNPSATATIAGTDRTGRTGRTASEGPTNPLTVPAPAVPIAESYLATMVKAQIDDKAVIPQTVTEADLIDVAYVTVETVFDGAALLAALKFDPEGPTRPMPEHWWSGQIALLGIELERQEMQANGEWGKAVTIKASKFGDTSVEQAGDPALTGTQLREIAKVAIERPELVRRPRPPAPYLGEDWSSPSEVEHGRPNAAEQARLRKDIDGLEDKLKKIDDQIKLTPSNKQNERRLKALQDQKRDIMADLAEKVARHQELAAGPKAAAPEVPGPKDPKGAGGPGVIGAANVEPLLSTSGIRVWAHDTDVKRNHAYRYRVRAVVNNPMFNQSAGLPADQKDLAKAALAVSVPTEWTQPVRVDPELYYFITSADDNKDAKLAQIPVAVAEVFSFSMGFWRTDSVRMHPGDPLLAEIPVPTLEQIRLAAANPNGNDGGNPPVPDPRRDTRTPGSIGTSGGGSTGKGAGGIGGGDGGGTPNQRPPRPTEPGLGQPKPAAPAPVKPRLVPVAVPVYLLDVAAAPAAREGTGDRYQAFLRSDDGTIEVRIPEDDRQLKIYQRVRLSVEASKFGALPQVEIPKDRLPPAPGPGEKPVGGPGGG